MATRIRNQQIPPPVWDDETHFQGTNLSATPVIEQVAGWTFALDALNFCFWAQGSNPNHRWQISTAGTVHNGYMALALALRNAANTGMPIWSPDWLASVTDKDIRALFAPVTGSPEIPLLTHRTRNLVELGRAMQHEFPGPTPFTDLIESCHHAAPQIANAIIQLSPSFNDVASWSPPDETDTREIRFHKRAQILASDLAGALQPHGLVIRQREQLTAFADYKVPQVLRELGVLRYAQPLADRIHRRELLTSGSREEIEIRAATIWACEWLRQSLSTSDVPFTASDIDWLLWNQGQHLPATTEPYHRTVTIFY